MKIEFLKGIKGYNNILLYFGIIPNDELLTLPANNIVISNIDILFCKEAENLIHIDDTEKKKNDISKYLFWVSLEILVENILFPSNKIIPVLEIEKNPIFVEIHKKPDRIVFYEKNNSHLFDFEKFNTLINNFTQSCIRWLISLILGKQYYKRLLELEKLDKNTLKIQNRSELKSVNELIASDEYSIDKVISNSLEILKKYTDPKNSAIFKEITEDRGKILSEIEELIHNPEKLSYLVFKNRASNPLLNLYRFSFDGIVGNLNNNSELSDLLTNQKLSLYDILNQARLDWKYGNLDYHIIYIISHNFEGYILIKFESYENTPEIEFGQNYLFLDKEKGYFDPILLQLFDISNNYKIGKKDNYKLSLKSVDDLLKLEIDKKIELNLYWVKASLLMRLGRFEESLEVVNVVKTKYENKENESIVISIANNRMHKAKLKEIISDLIYWDDGIFVKDYGDVLFLYGTILYYLADYNNALEIYKECFNERKKTNIRQDLINASFQIAGIYLSQRQFNRCIKYYELCQNSLSSSDVNLSIMIERNFARCYQHLQEFDKALDYSKLAYSKSIEIDDPRNIALSMMILAKTYHCKGELEKAKTYFEECIRFLEDKSFDNETILSLTLFSVINLICDLDVPRDAKEYLNKLYKLNLKTTFEVVKTQYKLSKARIFLNEDANTAKKLLLEIIDNKVIEPQYNLISYIDYFKLILDENKSIMKISNEFFQKLYKFTDTYNIPSLRVMALLVEYYFFGDDALLNQAKTLIQTKDLHNYQSIIERIIDDEEFDIKEIIPQPVMKQLIILESII